MENLNKKNIFIKKCINKYGNSYDYSVIEYISSTKKVKIKCNKHDVIFSQTPAEHLRGKKSCELCNGKNKIKEIKEKKQKNKNKILTLNEFKNRAIKKHGDKYDYSLVDYQKSNIKIKIICPEHGIFEQYPYSHIRGKGCSKCSHKKTANILTCSLDEFILKSKKKHGDKYDYSLVDYVNSHTKVKIICKEHGEFKQLPYDHISNHGCEKCSSSISSYEYEINNFLISNNIKTLTSSRSIIQPSQLDIYIPSHNLAIEFNGLYWHSEEYLHKNYHLNKTNECNNKGIKLIHIFEDEWLYKKNIVKSRLLNILGLTSKKIYARNTEIKEVSNSDSKNFINDNHLQGFSNSSIKIGLYYNNELVSLMMFNKPRLGIGKSYDGYELTRFCNKLNINVVGGASKILKYFIKLYNPKEIISYADMRWSQGNLYEKLGFTQTHINKPNYWYIVGKKRKHRLGFRKDKLKNEGFEIINKTEFEIMRDLGYDRIWDCGTLKFELCVY